MPPAPSELLRARFLGLCAGGRYAEAEAMVEVVYAHGSMPDGAEMLAWAGFYEDWGDAAADLDADVARTAYLQAEELYGFHASWSWPAAGRSAGSVGRIGTKLAALAAG